VRVQAISLNRGEVRRTLNAQQEERPGWDFAGVVEKQAANGTGPKAGARVVGLCPNGAWSEQLAVEPDWIAELPEQVSVAAASTLPVAGLTAYHALRQGGLLMGKHVLVTGASGGVGYFACQLAQSSGARVVATMRDPKHAAALESAGVKAAAVATDVEAIRRHAPYDLVLDSVAGTSLATALGCLKPSRTCVTYGVTEAAQSTFDVRTFFFTGGASLYGLVLFYELRAESASVGLGRLAGMVAAGKLRTNVELEQPIERIGEVARSMYDRAIVGKAVPRF
jgi:NADPH:quinone reductase-like Zn-dependent oxidoreductase